MKEENISHAKPKKKVYFHNFKEIVRMWKMIGKNIHFIVKQAITKEDTSTQKIYFDFSKCLMESKNVLKVGSKLK